jgi:hypothetical protein
MRSLALLAIVLGCGAAQAAAAQSLSGSALTSAAFASPTAESHAFAPLLQRQTVTPAGAPVQWNSSEMQLTRPGGEGPVDSLRVSVGGTLESPGGLTNRFDRAQFEARDYEVSVIRNWPRAISWDTGRFDLGLSPHAGVGMTSRGGSAEAGAELRLESRDDKAANKLRAMGISDGKSFGEQGRWYLFAAASGRAVGLNMLRGEGGWDRAGWTTDATSSLVGDAQVGVGWRKGDVQTSFGFIHREVKGSHMIFGQETKDDSLVAFSFSVKPRAK